VQLLSEQLIDGFRAGLHPGKVSHHLATNYRIRVDGDRAELWAHGYAWNRVPALPAGTDLWETWGNYRLIYRRGSGEWRLDGFRYYSKLTRGNSAVRHCAWARPARLGSTSGRSHSLCLHRAARQLHRSEPS
jgi:hypothetical protein